MEARSDGGVVRPAGVVWCGERVVGRISWSATWLLVIGGTQSAFNNYCSQLTAYRSLDRPGRVDRIETSFGFLSDLGGCDTAKACVSLDRVSDIQY